MPELTQEVFDRAIQLQQQAKDQKVAAALAAQQAAAAEAERTRSRTFGEAVSDTALAGLQGAVGLGQSVYGVANLATLGGLDALTGMSDNFKRTNQILTDARSAPLQRDMQAAQQAFDAPGISGIGAGLKAYATSPSLLGDALASNAASLIPAGAVSRFAAGRALAYGEAKGLAGKELADTVGHASEKAVLGTVGLQTGGSTNVDATNSIRDQGGSTLEQAAGGVVGGTLAGLSAAVIGKYTGGAKFQSAIANALPGGVREVLPTSSVLGGAVSGFAREATEEGLQSSAQQMSQNAVTPNTSLWQGVGQQGAVGSLVGGLLGGGTGAFVGAVSPKAPPSPRTASPLRDMIGNLMGKANQDVGGALTGSPLSNPPPLPVVTVDHEAELTDPEHVDLSATPAPAEVVPFDEPIDLAATPTPDEHVNLADTPLPGQTTPEQEALATLNRQTMQQELGHPADEEINLGDTPAPVEQPTIEHIDLDSLPANPGLAPQGTSWKSHLAKDLGLKPQSLRGKVWDDFSAAAEAAGVDPSSPNAEEFLKTVAPQLVNGSPTPPLFAAKLQDKYAPVNGGPDPHALPKTSDEAIAMHTAKLARMVAANATAAAKGTESKYTPKQIKSVRSDIAALKSRAAAAAISPEAAPVAPTAGIADQVTRQAATLNEVAGPVRRQEASTAGSPGIDQVAAPADINEAVAKARTLDDKSTAKSASVDTFAGAMVEATSPEQLDQVYAQAKAAPIWDELNAEEQAVVNDQFATLYGRVPGGDPGKFQRGPAVSAPIGTQEFVQLVAKANAARGVNDVPVIPLESPSDFEVRTGQSALTDARGIFNKDAIYLVRQNIGSAKDLAITLAHERGHQGLSVLLGDRLTSVTNRLWTNAAIRPRIKAKMQAEGLSRSVAAEEVLADMLAGNEKLNGDVIRKARAAIENGLAKALGIGHMNMTNAEVDALMHDVGRVNSGFAPSDINPDAGHLQGIVNAMGDPATLMVGDARFSRAIGDLDSVINDANNEQGAPRKSINDVTQDAANAALTKVKGLGDAFKTGGVFNAFMSAMPLNQIESAYHKLLPQLTPYVKLKDRKEAEANRLVTEPKKLEHRGTEYTVSPVDLAREAEKFKRTAPKKAEALDNLSQYATLYKLHPGEAFDKQSKIKYSAHIFTLEERQAALTQINALYEAAGPEGRSIYHRQQASYSFMWNQRFQALRNEIQRATGKKIGTPEFDAAFGKNINSALKKLKEGPYSPLQRYGDYFVTVRDAKGKVADFRAFDTKALADSYAGSVRTETGNEKFSVNTTVRTSMDWQRDGISAKTVADLEAVSGAILPGDDKIELRKEVSQALVEAYLATLPQQSFLTAANKRKGVAGFNTDTLRAYSDYSMKAARSIASLKYDGQISEQLKQMQKHITAQTNTDTTKAQRVLEAVKAQHAAAQDFSRSPTADLLTQGGFVFFMTSPSQFFMNVMQTVMVTLPRLAGEYGNGKGLGSLKSAMGALVKSRGDMLGAHSSLDRNSNEFKLMEEMRVRGDINATYAHDVAGLARGDAAAMSGHWRTAMEVAGYAMHKSEQINRQVVAHATAKLELEKAGITGAITPAQLTTIADKIKSAIDTTQFNYAKYNKPTLLQGPWRKAIFQFQQYRLNMLAMMAKDIRDGLIAKDASPEEKLTARRALAWQLGTQLALTGTAGTVMAPLVFGIMDLFRDDDDLLDSRTEHLNGYPQWLTHGVLSKFIDTSRIGSDSLIPLLGDRKNAPTNGSAADTASYYIIHNVGPWAGLLTQGATGFSKALQGDSVGAVKGLLPAPLRDAYKAVYEAGNGARDAKQVTYFEPGVWDTVATSLGLKSGDRRDAEELRGSAFQANSTAMTLRQRYLGQLAVGTMLGDRDMVDRANDSIGKFNTLYPDLGIKGNDRKRAVVSQVRSQINADQFGFGSGRAPAQSILTTLGK